MGCGLAIGKLSEVVESIKPKLSYARPICALISGEHSLPIARHLVLDTNPVSLLG